MDWLREMASQGHIFGLPFSAVGVIIGVAVGASLFGKKRRGADDTETGRDT